MELSEKGIIDDRVTGGLDLSWDNGDRLIPLIIEKIAHREGLGDILAEGPYGAIQKFRPESDQTTCAAGQQLISVTCPKKSWKKFMAVRCQMIMVLMRAREGW